MQQRLLTELGQELSVLRSKDLYRSTSVVSSKKNRGRSNGLLDFSSNDYLGLSTHPTVSRRAAEAALRWGGGSGASRLISGSLKIHEDLEKKIATFKKEEAATIFSSGYLANLGVVTSLVNEKDIVFIDRLNHASLIDAARLSRAKLQVYPHRDAEALAVLLKRAKNFRRKLVVTDAYFSMDGHVAPLDKLLEVCEKNEATLMIDEAHSTGVFGKNGRGLTEHFSLSGKIPVVMGTLSKALGSVGGYIAGSSVLKETLVNTCRPFIFTTAPAPAASAAALAAIEMIEEDKKILQNLWENIHWIRERLETLGFDLMDSEGPVIPVLIGDTAKTLKAREFLKRRRIWAPAIRPPTVPKNTDRIRLSLSGAHSRQDLERLVNALVEMRNSWKN